MWMSFWIGRGFDGGQPDGWPAAAGSHRDAPAKDLVAHTRTWGFSTAAAHRAVQGRTWKDLVKGWGATTKAIGTERSPSRRLALVMLRAAILDEMEAQQPQAFAIWLAEQRGPRDSRRG